MTRCLAYTPMAAGHVFPLVPGLTELRRRGHHVVVVTHPDLVDTLRAAAGSTRSRSARSWWPASARPPRRSGPTRSRPKSPGPGSSPATRGCW